MGIIYKPPGGGGGGSADAPTDFSLTEINSVTIQVDWTDTGDGVEYQLQQSLDSGTTWTEVAFIASGVETYSASLVAAGETFFRLRAITLDDSSQFVQGSITTVPSVIPAAGQIVFLESGGYNGTTWTDSSVEGNDFVSGNGSTSPSLITGWRNGENAARITSSGQYLKNESMPPGLFNNTGGRFTLGFVFERGSGTEHYLWQAGRASWVNTINAYIDRLSATRMRMRGAGGSAVELASDIPANTPTILIVRSVADLGGGGTPCRFYINGVTGSFTIAGQVSDDFVNWYMFATRVSNSFFTGTVNDLTIGEMIAYDRDLSDTEVGDLASVWSSKFDIALS